MPSCLKATMPCRATCCRQMFLGRTIKGMFSTSLMGGFLFRLRQSATRKAIDGATKMIAIRQNVNVSVRLKMTLNTWKTKMDCLVVR